MLSCLHLISCSDTGMIKMQSNRSVPAVTKPVQPSPGTLGWTFSCCINVKTTELSLTTSVPADCNLILSCSFHLTPATFMSKVGRNPPDSLVSVLLVFCSIVWIHNSEPTLISRMVFWRRNQTDTKSAQFLVVSWCLFLLTNQTSGCLGKIQCQSFSWKYMCTYENKIHSLSFNQRIHLLNKLINK